VKVEALGPGGCDACGTSLLVGPDDGGGGMRDPSPLLDGVELSARSW
jgi:hypothetical protein